MDSNFVPIDGGDTTHALLPTASTGRIGFGAKRGRGYAEDWDRNECTRHALEVMGGSTLSD